MTPEAQRIAIAETCGWKRDVTKSQILEIVTTQWYQPDGEKAHPYAVSGLALGYYLPDYLSDLNAMHEAEKVLNQGQKTRYIYHLQTLCGGQQFGDNYFATAAQRAEAFLCTLGKWVD